MTNLRKLYNKQELQGTTAHPFDEILRLHGYTQIADRSTETLSRWTNGKYFVSCDDLSWSILRHCGSWEKSGNSISLLAEELDRRKL